LFARQHVVFINRGVQVAVLVIALAMVLLLWAAVLLAFADPLAARWREPVIKHPALVIESDDWGAGPLQQAEALEHLSALLRRVRDCKGRPAVMTLGVVLEVPDGARIADAGCAEYHSLSLRDACFDEVRAAMFGGIEAGVFAPQLHGQSHYWPKTLLAAAEVDSEVRAWLTSPAPALTELLPSHLQSRWVDASILPSRAHDPADIQRAVSHEAADFAAIFGQVPSVAVATTFVWNAAVEAAWAQAGVEVIISPGRRATCRNAKGQPGCVDQVMLTGEYSLSGPTYLVRDLYFEPVFGHTQQRFMEGLMLRTRQGRASLVETHRSNFLQAGDSAEELHSRRSGVPLDSMSSLDALEQALTTALAVFPGLRFVTPLELARAIQIHDPDWIEARIRPRLSAWKARLDEIPRFRRVAKLSGLSMPLALLGHAQ
jgi:hypothetical protein